ncbi:APC family permease [Solibacillus sp. FSL K6-1523]|uniref:APC family permease n=1 Tax=Solibacillus sp. FSL K6-1523 TaxID=2921471 RepID=UPI0030F8B9F0
MSEVNLVRRLTGKELVVFGLSLMAPITIFTTFGIASEVTDSRVPLAYIFTALALSLTGYCYAQMVKAFPISGSAYSYVHRAVNSKVGFLVGWALLTSYALLPMVNYLVAAIFLHSILPQIPYAFWIILLIVLNTFVNIKGTKMASWVNTLLLIYSLLVVSIFSILCIRYVLASNEASTLFTLTPLMGSGFDMSMIMAGASLLCFSYLGFDSITTLAEEVIEPKKTIPRAIYSIIAIGTLMFVVVSYLGTLVQPNYRNFTNLDSAAVELVTMVGGNLFVSFFLAGTLIGCFASGLASQASASRVLYAMGRDNMLPQVFASLSPKYKTPVFNLLLIAAISLLSFVMTLTLATSFINFGALIAFLFVNVSVVFHYYIKTNSRSFGATIKYLIIPSLGSLFIIYLLFKLDSISIIFGIVWGAIGVCYLIYLVKFKGMNKINLQFSEEG